MAYQRGKKIPNELRSQIKILKQRKKQETVKSLDIEGFTMFIIGYRNQWEILKQIKNSSQRSGQK